MTTMMPDGKTLAREVSWAWRQGWHQRVLIIIIVIILIIVIAVIIMIVMMRKTDNLWGESPSIEVKRRGNWFDSLGSWRLPSWSWSWLSLSQLALIVDYYHLLFWWWLSGLRFSPLVIMGLNHVDDDDDDEGGNDYDKNWPFFWESGDPLEEDLVDIKRFVSSYWWSWWL